MIAIFGLFLVFSRKLALLSCCAAQTTTSTPVVSYPYLMVVTFKDDLTDREKLILTNASTHYVGVDTSYGTDKFIKVDSNPVYVDTKTGFVTFHTSPSTLNNTEIETLKEIVARMIPNLLNFQNNVDNVYMELTQLDAALSTNGVSASALRRFFSKQKLKYFLEKKNLQLQQDTPEAYTLIAIY